MKSQPDDQLVERIQPQIAYLAAKGRRAWDPVKLDTELLESVPLVKARLTELDADRTDPDAKLKAIVSVLEAAIKTLPKPYSDAALAHFGFTDEGSGDSLLQGAREALAARALRYGSGWYRKPHAEYFGMKTSQYVIALVACAFCGIGDPFTYIAKRESGGVEPTTQEPQAEQGSAPGGALDASTAPAATEELASLGATMVSRDPDHLEVFWTGPNNEVFYRWWLPWSGWSPPESWADPAAISLTAVSREAGDEILFGLAPDGHVWYRVWELDDRGWHKAGDVYRLDDEVVRGPLASASRGADMVELFAFDKDGTPWHRWTEGGMNWSPWTYW